MRLLEKMLKDNPNNVGNPYDIPIPRDYFAESLARRRRKRQMILFGVITLVVATLGLCIYIGLSIRHSNFVAQAKNIVAQEDIKSTFKDPEFPDGEDWDKDGLKNEKETQLGTNLQSKDTDKDGLTDADELKIGSDPKKEDTDGDGLPDGCEVMTGLSPLTKKTNGITNDISRVVTVNKKQGEVEINIKGDAKSANASVEELDLFSFNSNTSLVSKAYDAYCPDEFISAEVTFNLDENKINRLGINKNDLTVLSFNSSTQKFTKIPSSLDSTGTKITAKVEKLGTFVVGTEKNVNKEPVTRVFFLIDNSGSMYPKTMCADSTENDVHFKRIDFAEKLVKKFSKNYQVAVSKYTGTYTKLCGFTSDKKAVKNALESIKTTDEFFNGTHSQTAMLRCINEFENSGSRKYKNIIVMLTDGESDETNASTLDFIKEQAKDKNIVVLTVGLGGDVDRKWLHELASGTGGRYYSASESGAFEDVYSEILTSMNYDMVHYNNEDDTIVGYSLYNTGFKPDNNGFNFKNFRTSTTTGVDFGMAVMARDWYMGKLKKSLPEIIPSDSSKQKVTASACDISKSKIWREYSSHNTLNWLSSEMLSGTFSDVKEYLDYDNNGKVLQIKSDLKSEAISKGWIIQNKKIKAKNFDWETAQMLSLDVANGLDKIKKGYGSDDAKLASYVYRLNALRWDDRNDEYSLADGEGSFIRLEQNLALGVPVVTTIDDKRTVNAVSLIEDAKCHRKYVLQVYDNSYPDKMKEIYIEKKPVCVLDEKGKLTGNDYVYTATYEGKQVGIAFSDVETH